jgi:DNA repair exonuclease SbcCD nuclease subunit
MKIAFISDTHFGYASGTGLEDDTFDAMVEAFEKAVGSDVILLGGDIFDTKTPSNETLVRVMEVLLSHPISGSSSAKLSEGVGKEMSKIHSSALSGIPVVAIHGTHERRAEGLLNPVQLLERAGFIVYLDRNGVVFQKGEEKVCVQGLSGVPDRHTEETLKEWNPKPVPGCLNIFMIHQNLTEFMHEKVEHTLDISKLPKGFDFYVCGHIHETVKKEHDGGVILLPGSLVPTQFTKDFIDEGGFWTIDSETKQVEFIKLEKQRKVYVRTFDSETSSETIDNETKKILSETHHKKPIIRIKLIGKQADLPLKQIETKYEDSAVISIKKDFEKESLPQAKGIEEHKLSVNELGRKIMKENLSQFKLDESVFESVFELLLERRADDVLKLLSSPENKMLSKSKEQATKVAAAVTVQSKEKHQDKKEAGAEEESEPAESMEPETKPVQDTGTNSWKGFLKGA